MIFEKTEIEKIRKTIALADQQEFMNKTYRARSAWEDEEEDGTKKPRDRFFADYPYKRFNEVVKDLARLKKFEAKKAVILYTYYTKNGPYKNYWYRALLLDGPNMGKVVSI